MLEYLRGDLRLRQELFVKRYSAAIEIEGRYLAWTEYFGGPCGGGMCKVSLTPLAVRVADKEYLLLCSNGCEYPFYFCSDITGGRRCRDLLAYHDSPVSTSSDEEN
jgi:hypothetical protein